MLLNDLPLDIINNFIYDRLLLIKKVIFKNTTKIFKHNLDDPFINIYEKIINTGKNDFFFIHSLYFPYLSICYVYQPNNKYILKIRDNIIKLKRHIKNEYTGDINIFYPHRIETNLDLRQDTIKRLIQKEFLTITLNNEFINNEICNYLIKKITNYGILVCCLVKYKIVSYYLGVCKDNTLFFYTINYIDNDECRTCQIDVYTNYILYFEKCNLYKNYIKEILKNIINI